MSSKSRRPSPSRSKTTEAPHAEQERPKRQPRYHVILWNDDDHSYAYVMRMLQQLFGHPPEQGYQLAERGRHPRPGDRA